MAVSQSNFTYLSDITYKETEGVQIDTPSLVIGDVLRNILQAAVQNRTQFIQRMGRYWHICLEPLNSGMAHTVLKP